MRSMKKVIISGVDDSRNNGCWAMASAIMDEMSSTSPIPIEFYYLASKNSDEANRFPASNIHIVSTPWSAINIPKTRKIYRLLCLFFLTLQALIFRVTGIKHKFVFKNFWQVFLSADLIVDISGDSISKDYGSLSVALSLLPLVLSRLIGTPYFLCAQSVGPFGDSFIFNVTKAVLKDANLITTREQITFELLQQHNISRNVVASADLAFLLQPCTNGRLEEICQLENIDRSKRFAGFSVSSLIGKFAFRNLSGGQQYDEYISAMANLADYIIERHNLDILFIPHVTIPNKGDDRIASKDVIKKMHHSERAFMPEHIYNASELKNLISLCFFFIGSRMHATIGALSQAIPTITYVYNHKTLGINGKMLGLQDYLIDIREIEPNTLLSTSKNMVDKLLKNRAGITKQLSAHLVNVRKSARINAGKAIGLLECVKPLLHMEDYRFCTGCGTCVAACKIQALIMETTADGTYRPRPGTAKCIDCGLCLQVCPMVTGIMLGDNREKTNKPSEISSLINRNLNYPVACFAGYATGKNIRFKAASGGLVSAITSYLLEHNKVDAVLVVKNDKHSLISPKGCWALTTDDILEAMGSKYIPIPLNEALLNIPEKADRLAVVGLPCHLWGIQQYETAGLLKEKGMFYRFGLFCGKIPSIYALNLILAKYDIDKTEILDFRYRGEGWPSGLKITTKTNTIEIPLNQIWSQLLGSHYFLPHHCFRCQDFFASESDISFGDAWLPKYLGDNNLGWSACIAGSNAGDQLLKEMCSDSVIHLESVEPDDLEQAFHENLRQKLTLRDAKNHVFNNLYPAQVATYNQYSNTFKNRCGIKFAHGLAQIGRSQWLTESILLFPANRFMKLSNKIVSKLLR